MNLTHFQSCLLSSCLDPNPGDTVPVLREPEGAHHALSLAFLHLPTEVTPMSLELSRDTQRENIKKKSGTKQALSVIGTADLGANSDRNHQFQV